MPSANASDIINTRTEAVSEVADSSRLGLAGQVPQDATSLNDYIRPTQSTADAVLPGIDLVAKVDLCDRKCPNMDPQGNPYESYMAGDQEVFRITQRPNETVYQSRNLDGTPEGRKSISYENIGGENVVSHVRSVFKDDNGKPVIIDRNGLDGKPEVKVDEKVVVDPKTIDALLQKEKAMFTPPTIKSVRDGIVPERGGPQI